MNERILVIMDLSILVEAARAEREEAAAVLAVAEREEPGDE